MLQSNRGAWVVGFTAVFAGVACGQAKPSAAKQIAQAAAAPSAPLPMGDAPGLSVSQLTDHSQSEWVRCYQGFVASKESKRDLLRLATMCGPATGMHELGPRYSGTIQQGVDTTVRVQLGRQCVRIVAAAAGTIEDLELELLPPAEGPSLALVNLGRSWAVLPKDKPVCTPKQGVYRVRLSSHSGEGPYDFRILEYWP